MSVLGNDTLPVPLACLFPETVLMGLQAQVSSRFFPFHLCSTPHLALGARSTSYVEKGRGTRIAGLSTRFAVHNVTHHQKRRVRVDAEEERLIHTRFRHGHVA